MLRNFDAHAKPVDGLRNHTAVGGVITLIAYCFAFILFVSQLVLYAKVEISQNFHIAESLTAPFLAKVKNPYEERTSQSKAHSAHSPNIQRLLDMRYKLPVAFHVTFPHLNCRDVEVAQDEARGEAFEKIHGKDAYTKRPPTRQEAKVTRMYTEKTGITGGCTVKGKLLVPKVGGMLAFTVTRESFNQVMFDTVFAMGNIHSHNSSHYIHSIEFGDPFPHSDNPLKESRHAIESDTGVGLNNIMVKLISTKYKRFARSTLDMHQVSVTQHMVAPNILAMQRSTLLPGIVIHYDFTPLAVHHVEGRENFFSFLSSLISIVGGVFVTVSLVSSCLVNTAGIAKKLD